MIKKDGRYLEGTVTKSLSNILVMQTCLLLHIILQLNLPSCIILIELLFQLSRHLQACHFFLERQESMYTYQCPIMIHVDVSLHTIPKMVKNHNSHQTSCITDLYSFSIHSTVNILQIDSSIQQHGYLFSSHCAHRTHQGVRK